MNGVLVLMMAHNYASVTYHCQPPLLLARSRSTRWVLKYFSPLRQSNSRFLDKNIAVIMRNRLCMYPVSLSCLIYRATTCHQQLCLGNLIHPTYPCVDDRYAGLSFAPSLEMFLIIIPDDFLGVGYECLVLADMRICDHDVLVEFPPGQFHSPYGFT